MIMWKIKISTKTLLLDDFKINSSKKYTNTLWQYFTGRPINNNNNNNNNILDFVLQVPSFKMLIASKGIGLLRLLGYCMCMCLVYPRCVISLPRSGSIVNPNILFPS